jgi:hypothetical protein
MAGVEDMLPIFTDDGAEPKLALDQWQGKEIRPLAPQQSEGV